MQINNPFGIPEPEEQKQNDMAEVPLDSPRKESTGSGPFADDKPLLEELEIDITKIK